MRIMIVGAGQVGYYLAQKLSVEGQNVVLVDRDASKLRILERELNILTVQGSGASTRVLEEAGIDQTDLFIAVTDSDEVNLVACIISKEYNVKTRIARVRNEDFYTQGSALSQQSLGIDLLISPDLAMTEEIIKLATRSEAFEVAEFAGGQVVLLGYVVHEDNPCVGKRLFNIRGLKGVIVAMLRGETTIIPRGEDEIHVDDKIYLVTRKNDIPEVESLFNVASNPPKRVFIIGGGRIGYLLARRMERMKIDVRIVEKDYERCNFLTENLEHSVVLHSHGLEAHDMLEEGVDRADLVVSVTNKDSVNILSSLLAKHHGAGKCITHIFRPDFIPMLDALGIDVALSPRLVAANMILRFVRGGGTIAVATLLASNAEVIEIKVPEKGSFLDIPLKNLHVPRGAIIGAIVREGRVLIPFGETVLWPDDNLIVFFTSDSMAAVHEFFEITA